METSPSKKKRKVKDISSKLSKEELVRQLKAYAQDLSNVDQDSDTTEYNDFAACLVMPFILNHKDANVRSFAACCLADILRIYAPEPPYNEEELKDIFRMMLEQLKNLENVQGPLYKHYFYILESLALVKTFNVCTEMDAQDIVLDLFKIFFTIISDKHNIRVKNFMLDVMSPLIQEGDVLPQELLNVILICLIDPRKTKRPEAYKLASMLLDRCATSIEPYIQLFFNNTIVLGQSAGPEMDDNLYDLLYELYIINKSVLLSVLPQLEFKLKGNEESERLQTVKLLGRMFAEEDSSLAETNKALWQCYLGRFLDVSAEVRLLCVQLAKQFLLSSEGVLRADITEQLVNRLQDPDEKVRLETVITICESAVENFDLIHDKLFNGVINRIRDKKWLIRRESVTCIGKLYKRLMANSRTSKKSLKRILDVPSKILHLYFQNSLDDRLCIERVVHGCLIPVTLPVENRMKRLFNVYYSLDEAGVSVFDGMLKHRLRVNQDFNKLLDCCQMEEGDDKKKKIFQATVSLARALPEPHKAQEHLNKLVTTMCNKSKKLYELLRTSTNVKEECPKIIKSVTEIIKTITSKNPIIETVKALLDRACPMIIDASSFVYLLKIIKDYIDEYGGVADEDDDDLIMKGKCGLKLVETLATVQPSLFQSKPCYEVLLLFIKHADPEIVERTLRILRHVMPGIEEVDKAIGRSFQPVLTKLLTQGSCKQAKYALRCIQMLTKDSTTVMERLFKNLVDKLDSTSSDDLRSTLAALREIALGCPEIFETQYKKVICEVTVKGILDVDKEDTSDSQEGEDEWGPDENISDETLTKVQAIKLLADWLLGVTNRYADLAKPVFRVLTTLLCNDGDLTNQGKLSAVNRSRLRIAAGLSMLKLVQSVHYVDVITTEQYQQLAILIQDSCFEVREQFTAKLHKALDTLKLSLDYLAILALVAADPSKERKVKVRQMIARNAQTRRDYSRMNAAVAARPYAILPEYSLPYVVHLLSHHPDFDHTDIKSLRLTKEYLWFFLEPIMGAKAENYSFLKKLLENIKQTRDKQNPDNLDVIDVKMYTVCDIAIGCVMNKNQTFTLKDFPGNLVLPRKLFQSDKTLNNTKNYLPPELFAPTPKQKTVQDVKGATTTKSKEKSENGLAKKITNNKKNVKSNLDSDDDSDEEYVPSKKKTRVLASDDEDEIPDKKRSRPTSSRKQQKKQSPETEEDSDDENENINGEVAHSSGTKSCYKEMSETPKCSTDTSIPDKDGKLKIRRKASRRR